MPYEAVITNAPGWESGARTIAQFDGDGGFTFSVGQCIGIVCGLNGINEGVGFQEIDHAFYITNGKFQIIENGALQTGLESFLPDVVFKITRIGGVVRYYVDDSLIYTSEASSSGPVFLDCSLYHYMDEIHDAALLPSMVSTAVSLLPLAAYGVMEEPAPEEDAAIVCLLEPLSSFGVAEDDPVFIGSIDARISPLNAAGQEEEDQGNYSVDADLLPLEAFGVDETTDLNQGAGELRPLEAAGSEVPDQGNYALDLCCAPLEASGAEAPREIPLNRINVAISPLAASGRAAPAPAEFNRAEANLEPLEAGGRSYASLKIACLLAPCAAYGTIEDYAFAQAANLLPLMAKGTAEASPVPEYNAVFASLPKIVAGGTTIPKSSGYAISALVSPLEAFGVSEVSDDLNIAEASLEPLTVRTLLAIEQYLAFTLPQPEIVFEAKDKGIYAAFPAFDGEISARITGVTIAGELPWLEGAMFSGARIEAPMPALQGEIGAQTQRKGDIAAAFPMLTGEALTGAHIESAMPALDGAMASQVLVGADIAAAFKTVEGEMRGAVPNPSSIGFAFKAFQGSIDAKAGLAADIEALMPLLEGSIGGMVPQTVGMEGILPMLSGALRGGRRVDHELIALMPRFGGTLWATIPAPLPDEEDLRSSRVLRYERGWSTSGLWAAFPAISGSMEAS